MTILVHVSVTTMRTTTIMHMLRGISASMNGGNLLLLLLVVIDESNIYIKTYRPSESQSARIYMGGACGNGQLALTVPYGGGLPFHPTPTPPMTVVLSLYLKVYKTRSERSSVAMTLSHITHSLRWNH